MPDRAVPRAPVAHPLHPFARARLCQWVAQEGEPRTRQNGPPAAPWGASPARSKAVAGDTLGDEQLAREGRLQEASADAELEAQRRAEEAQRAEAAAATDAERAELAQEREALRDELELERREEAAERDRARAETAAEADAAQRAAAAEADRRAEERAAEATERAGRAEAAAQEREAARLEQEARAAEARADAIDPEERWTHGHQGHPPHRRGGLHQGGAGADRRDAEARRPRQARRGRRRPRRGGRARRGRHGARRRGAAPEAAARRAAADAREEAVELRDAAEEREGEAGQRQAERAKAAQRRRAAAAKKATERKTAARRTAATRKSAAASTATQRKAAGRKAAAAKADARDTRAKQARLAQIEGEAEALDEREAALTAADEAARLQAAAERAKAARKAESLTPRAGGSGQARRSHGRPQQQPHVPAAVPRAGGGRGGARALVLDAGAGRAQYRGLFAHARYETADFLAVKGKKYAQPDYVCDLAAIPVADARFDHVVCTQVLEHLPEPQRVIEELGRVLKPGGTLWLSAPLFYAEHERPVRLLPLHAVRAPAACSGARGFEVLEIAWLEGYFGTLSYQVRVPAGRSPPARAAYGGGARAGRSPAPRAWHAARRPARGRRARRPRRAHKVVDAGLPKNHTVVARKPGSAPFR